MAKFEKGNQKPKNSGRQKGTPNKLTTTVKEAVLLAFNKMQEDETKSYSLVNWAQKNPKDFYYIASKLIPTEIASSSNAIIINVVTQE